MDSGFIIQGIAAAQANLIATANLIRSQIARGMVIEANRLLDLAIARTPVKTGQLRDSGAVSDPVITSDEISITMSFGGGSVTWAVAVHERTYIKHRTGQSKFLESVFLENVDIVWSNIIGQLSL